MNTHPASDRRPTTRRDFLRTSSALAATAALAPLALERSAHAAGSDLIRIGLIGCGGRGTEAALNAMNAGKDIRLVALADIQENYLSNPYIVRERRPGHGGSELPILRVDGGTLLPTPAATF